MKFNELKIGDFFERDLSDKDVFVLSLFSAEQLNYLKLDALHATSFGGMIEHFLPTDDVKKIEKPDNWGKVL